MPANQKHIEHFPIEHFLLLNWADLIYKMVMNNNFDIYKSHFKELETFELWERT